MTIILSIYLLAVSNIPCADLEVNSAVHQTAQFSADKNHSHDKENDLCSPFCVCNCCGAQILTHQVTEMFNFQVVYAIISIQLPTYKSIYTSNFFGSIWQPPQIA
jgi:hypothetical protein